MSTEKPKYICIHEEKFQDHEAKLERLDARVDYKEDKINQIIMDNKRMEDKIDDIKESIHQLKLDSAKDDFNIDNRVTSLESTVKTLKWILAVVLVPMALAVFSLALSYLLGMT